MSLWIFALAGAVFLIGAFACLHLKKKENSRKYHYLMISLGVLSAICFFFCIAALLLILGIE